MKVNLTTYNNSWYKPGGNSFIRFVWYFTNAFIFNSPLFPFNKLKIFLLKLFGATLEKGVVIKPSVNIKYPWNISIGENTWVGEKVWIDSLAQIKIGSNVCLSQEAYLLTGNHNYKLATFDLIVEKIVIEDGVWIGARAIVCPGITCFNHSVLTAGSVATKNLEAFSIYQGNPAVRIKTRELTA